MQAEPAPAPHIFSPTPPGTVLVKPAMRPTTEQLNTPLELYVVNQTIGDVITHVARMANLRVRINDRLDDILVSQRRLQGSVREALDELTRQYNLTWFGERDLVDIAKADTATVKTFQIGQVRDIQIRDAMLRYDIYNADAAVNVDEQNGIARVFGPPRLVSRIESIITGLKPPIPLVDAPLDIIRYGQKESTAPSR